MRSLNIASQYLNIDLSKIPKDKLFIAKIVSQLATDVAQFDPLYDLGCNAAEEYRAKNPHDITESKIVFYIRQKLLVAMSNKNVAG